MSMNEDRICKSPKKSPKKVNLAVVKQRKKEQGNLELLKTLDEYVRFLLHNLFIRIFYLSASSSCSRFYVFVFSSCFTI